MINFLAILLLGIAGASAECNDAGRVECYVDLYLNTELYDKESLCSQLPVTQQCVKSTGCPMDQLDNYLESLISSCRTQCDLFQSIECSKQFKRPTQNMTFCQALKEIKKCYSINKCDDVMNENPTFFQMCDNSEDQESSPKNRTPGRLGKILNKVKKTLKEKSQPPSTENPTGN